jgi:hypothetical protein
VPQREHGVALRRERLGVELRRLFVQPRMVLRAAQLAVGIGRGVADAGGSRPASSARCSSAMLPALSSSCGWRAACASTRYCTANSTSIMPPALCLTSKRPAGTGRAARTFSRMAWISSRSAAGSRSALSTARRVASKRGPIDAAPAAKRARVMAWCSQVHAVLLPRPRLVVLEDAMLVTSSPELPLGRSAVSMSNSSPALVRSVSQVMSLRTKAP